jgi:hypothetical protein
MRKLIVVVGLISAVCLAGRTFGQVAAPKPNAADEFVGAAPPESLAGAAGTALTGIRARALAAHIAFLASPALEGRGLGDRGLDAALEHVAAGLALAGIPPLGGEADGTHRCARSAPRAVRLRSRGTPAKGRGNVRSSPAWTAGFQSSLPRRSRPLQSLPGTGSASRRSAKTTTAASMCVARSSSSWAASRPGPSGRRRSSVPATVRRKGASATPPSWQRREPWARPPSSLSNLIKRPYSRRRKRNRRISSFCLWTPPSQTEPRSRAYRRRWPRACWATQA